MRNLACLAALAALSAVATGSVTACSSPTEETIDSDGASALSGGAPSPAPTGPTPIAGSTLKLPVPGSKGNKISAADQATIVAAWLGAKRDYYDTQKGYVGINGAAPVKGPRGLAEVATVPCGPTYSTLVCRFYAHMPSYDSVIPNYRGCFSYMANGGLQVPTSLWDPKAATEATTMRPGTYAESFDHCLYQDYDKVLNHTPLWSTTEVAANKKKGAAGEIGVVKYMAPDLRATFKFIMYTWYEPATYDVADQAAILAKIYASYTPPVAPPAVGGGAANPATYATVVDSMNAYIAANHEW